MCGFDARAFQSGVSVKNRGVAVIPLAAPLNDISPTSNPKHKEMTMPLINVKLIEGVFNETQKKKMVSDHHRRHGCHRRRAPAPIHLGGD